MADDQRSGLAVWEIAGLALGALLLAGFAAVLVDLATGGKLTRPKRKPCGCQDTEQAASNDD